jgi:histidinol-phosphate/aromatic aminotransferase/cobyric acid decarboxylase-like protein
MSISRPDWTIKNENSNKEIIDLSKNCCYDTVLNKKFNEFLNEIYFDIHLFPDDFTVYDSISSHYNLKKSNLAIGLGTWELIDRILYTFDYKTIYYSLPTWNHIQIISKKNNYKFCNNADVLYLENPNGQTGEQLSKDEVLKLIQNYKLVIIDEAYGDFGTYQMFGEEFENVFITKTFSKLFSFTGIRQAFAFSNEKLINKIQQNRMNFSSTSFSGLTLDFLFSHKNDHIQRMKNTKKYLENKYEHIKSYSNSVFLKERPMFIKKNIKILESNDVFRMALCSMDLIDR